MIRTGLFFCIGIFSATLLWGQGEIPFDTSSGIEESGGQSRRERTVNFGLKGGFTSSLFLASNFNLDGSTIDQIQNNYKIGYFGSFFMRINFGRHFLQPEVSYNVNRCNITFDKPLLDDAPEGHLPEEASVTSAIHSIDIPVIYGYNIVKEKPYSLAIFGGPKIRYILGKKSDVTFENFDQLDISEELWPLNLSFTTGVAVTISRIFFDFRYDIGLHNISRRVSYRLPPEDGKDAENHAIRFHRRDNVLSFSLGVFF